MADETGPREEALAEALPPYQLATWAVLGAAFVVALVLFSVRGPFGPESSRDYPSRNLPPDPAPVLLTSEMDDEYWPCSDCHEGETTNRQVRELEDEHEDMKVRHGDLWCFSCHYEDDRDMLSLADGQLVRFEDSWRLCTQCHGKKLADWRAGVHGKRTGHWWGPKEFRTCVKCHNPHSPPFKPIEPLPPPWRPQEISRDGRLVTEVPHE
jgi:hypothetical protein